MEVLIALFIFFGPTIFFAYRAHKYKKEKERLFLENKSLEPFREIIDAHAHAAQILAEADEKLSAAREKEREILKQIQSMLQSAQHDADHIIHEAEQEAKKIAGGALDIKANAELYERTVRAMKNIIKGYGSEYIIPSRSLLDDLAETYGYTQAGEDLKRIRALMLSMIKDGEAATCDYVEASRSDTAVNFVTDAFNGKVDSIISRAKADNFGKLKQEVIDAYSLVNYNGKAFRNARITEKYFNVRLDELKLACTMYEIRQRDLEEQRRIKEQIREEERARREIEKALRDAAKEEETIQKAMDKARAQMEQASEEQRAKYEAQIAELEQKWKEAEERNQRAKSMAEQTKSGHVYIISNIGSFGEDVYKIGMTRRLEPLDRVRELGDASVPFSFDVHAMIWAEDAPSLETKLHKRFMISQVNKVNHRKEFFRVNLQEIREELEKDEIEIKWTMTAGAREYRESLAIEEALRNNPEAQRAWLEREFALEERSPVEVLSAVDSEAEAE
jgi:hypothetical protein